MNPLRRLPFLLLPLLWGFAASCASDDIDGLPKVVLLPLGGVDDALIEAVVKGAEDTYRLKVVVLKNEDLPPATYYEPRKRWRADKLLAWLENRSEVTGEGYLKIVGLTEKDISTTKGEIEDWGVFGLGYLPGKACVVSTFRLGAKAEPAEAARLKRERLVKVVIHEIGHNFGLDHCPEIRCTMQDAMGSILTVDRENGFCRKCTEVLGANLRD
jgi:archaemetzincin